MKYLLRFFLSLLLLFISIFLYSKYIGTKKIIVKEYRIKHENISENFSGIKIVHFGDIHYGTTIKEKELKDTIQKIKDIEPDLVIFTGDLLESTYKINEKEEKMITTLLQSITATLGKYTIKGEQDNKEDYFERIMNNSDFINISDSFDYVYYKSYTPILLAGLSSNLTNKKDSKQKASIIENEIVTNRQNGKTDIYNILLMHEPDFLENLDLEKYDLVLAGHSHNGQINIPYIQNLFLEKGAQKYYKNYYQIKNTDIYITSGLGTHKYPHRLFNKPSINLYRLEAK